MFWRGGSGENLFGFPFRLFYDFSYENLNWLRVVVIISSVFLFIHLFMNLCSKKKFLLLFCPTQILEKKFLT